MAEAFARSEPTRLVSTFAEIDEKLKRNQHLAFLNNEEALNTMSESSSHRIMHALNNVCLIAIDHYLIYNMPSIEL
jgi:hypothetical protein